MSIARLISIDEAMRPVVPSWYPKRAVRRAVKQRRESRLTSAWKAFLALNPNIRQHILTV